MNPKASINFRDDALLADSPAAHVCARSGPSADRVFVRRDFLRASVAMSLMIGGLPARAQTAGGVIFGFPLRPSTEDLIAVLLAELQPRYRPDLGKRPTYVPGAGGATAMAAVADAPPDGASVLLSSAAR